jgi:hypothetical protein
MNQGRQKRLRGVGEGGSSHNFIPLSADDYLDIHTREGCSMKIGSQKFTSSLKRVTQKSHKLWRGAASWGPLDNPDFALDSDGALYDEAVDAPIMQDANPPAVTVGMKNAKSKVSVSLPDLYLILNLFLCLRMTEASSSRLERKLSVNLLE